MKKQPLFAGLAGLLLLAGCSKEPSAPQTAASDPGVAAVPAPAPAGKLPADIPLPAGSAFQMAGDEKAGSASLDAATTPAMLAEFFSSQLPENGWLLAETAREGTGPRLVFTRDARRLVVRLANGGGPGISKVQFEWQTAESAAEDRDSFEPENDEEAPAPDGAADVPAP